MPRHLESPLLSTRTWAAHSFGTRQPCESPESVSTLKQIHSNLVLLADRTGVVGEGDALITNRAGLAIAIRTADCYPILLADSKNEAIAAIHAGWRGTAAQIVGKTLARGLARRNPVENDRQNLRGLTAVWPAEFAWKSAG